MTNPGVAGAPEVDMIKSYGSITLETFCAVKLAYIFTKTRLGQDNRLLYKCLMSTLTKAARHKVSIKEQEYQAHNPNNTSVQPACERTCASAEGETTNDGQFADQPCQRVFNKIFHHYMSWK